MTQSLFYATDFVDRLENEIVPALRAGFIVLTDRYIYSLMARAIVRGMDPHWIRSIYSVALKPDAVFYLRLGIDQLVPRVIFTRGFDYWESGMDLYPGHDMYDSFCNYQAALLAEFDRLSSEFNFQMVDAARDAKTVCEHLKENILQLLEKDSRKSFMAKVYDEPAARSLSEVRARPVFDTRSDTRIDRPVGALPGVAPAVARATNGNGHHATHQK